MVGFRGTTPASDAHLRQALADGLGGVILFDRDVLTGDPVRNIESPPGLARTVAELRELSPGDRLLVSIDQEGGTVSRLHPGNGYPTYPGASATAAEGVTATAANAAAMAEALAHAGVDVNLAPVVDVALDPGGAIAARGRAFSDEPDAVLEHARAFVEAHRSHGVATSLKHFPGLGSGGEDTHEGSVDITESFVREIELAPYRRLIAEGLADSVLVGHPVHRGLDAERPASMSRAIVTELLRGELGFDGAVLTDDLDMGAAAEVDLEERVVRALEAGVDVILSGNQLTHEDDRAARVTAAVVRAVESGRVDRGQLEASRERLARLRTGTGR